MSFMSFYAEIRNEHLIRELQRETNTDVLLFGVDGFTYFGNMQSIDDCRIAVLTPAREASTSDVEILTPGGELRAVTFLRVDLWTIVGKGTSIVSDPIACSGSQGSSSQQSSSSQQGQRIEDLTDRQESHHLIHQLKRMIGDNVAITTLGGFLFEGILSEVDDELATMVVDDVFGPGTSSSISDSQVRSVVVNLEALTSVSSTTTSISC
jgi:small nuclear ribonucleoprotein (snRNP)-like protein